MILHTVNKSPLRHRVLSSCLQFMNGDDILLLIEDGVYAAMDGLDCGLDRAPGEVYALDADVLARGLQDRLAAGINVIGYGDFVDLCAESRSVKNWS